MTIALYELTADFIAVADKLSASDLDEQTIADTLEAYAADFDNKVVAIASLIRNIEATAEAIKAAEADMATRRKAMENKAASLRNYVLTNLKATGKDRVECPLFKVSVRNNAPSVSIAEGSIIPAEFIKTKTELVTDKKALKEALEAGQELPGITLVRSNTLSIK